MSPRSSLPRRSSWVHRSGLRLQNWVRRTKRAVRASVVEREAVATGMEAFSDLRMRLSALRPPTRWSRGWWYRVRQLVVFAIALALLAVAVASVGYVLYALITDLSGNGRSPRGLRDSCEETGLACTVTVSLFLTAGPILVASGAILYWRTRRVKRPFVRAARENPTEFVETAGDIVGDVVGRDDLCEVVQADLRDRQGRRPHVIVAGVGAGKTAVLVRLTERLERSGAVPVAVRMRDAERDVDFLAMAKSRFIRDAQTSLVSETQAEQAWRRLRKDDKIVVLADGLEEALADGDVAGHERDHRIRVAVSHARRRRYPLVIASRPHDALIGLDAALVHLEPLNKDAALEYIRGGHTDRDGDRLNWLVERGVVVESPLFLQIARELRNCDRLTHRHLNTRGADRVKLRAELLKSWIEALIAGSLEGARGGRQPVALTKWEREAAVERISALACCGLAEDKLEVTFEMYEKPSAADGRPKTPRPNYDKLTKRIDEKLAAARHPPRVPPDMQLAVNMAARMGLVEHRTNGTRFPHSIMQAYLGSRLMREALMDEGYRRKAFASPGKEFLVALVLFSRTDQAKQSDHPGEGGGTWLHWLTDELVQAASVQNRHDKSINLLAAAVEVESMAPSEDGPPLAATAANDRWHTFTARDDSVLDAKLNFVERLGEAALRPIRERYADTAPVRAAAATDTEPTPGQFPLLFDLCARERLYRVRLAGAQQIGAGGEDAFRELEGQFCTTLPLDADVALKDELRHRSYTLEAWVMPMLAGSDTGHEGAARGQRVVDRLDKWVALVGDGMPLSIEAALAQGFKYAANRRPQPPFDSEEARSYLARRTQEMLEKAEYWFSRLTLLHALCLWHLTGVARDFGENGDPRPDVQQRVLNWIERPGGSREHRFVYEAAKLVIAAIRTGRPERYIWIDESGVTTKVGSRSDQRGADPSRRLWIPPSSGWLALEGRAQQLVADVLILLNLAERGATRGGRDLRERETRLHRINNGALPYCLCEDRIEHLMPIPTPARGTGTQAGGCKTGCPVGLCPYPPKSEQAYRVELSEAFCRNQRELLGHRGRRGWGPAPWQDASRSELRDFWTSMEQRARV
jgi:hypothetical protein